MPARVIGSLVVALAGPSLLPAAEPPAAGEAKSLSINDCFKLALEKNLDIQIQRHSTRINDYQLAGSYSIYDPKFSVSPTRTYFDQPRTIDPKKPGEDVAYHQTTDSLMGGIDGKLPTGMSYHLGSVVSSLSAKTFFTPAESAFLTYPPSGIRSLANFNMTSGLTLTQPLLKDFWIDSDRLKIQVNKQNIKSSELAFTDRVMQTVLNIQMAYYDAYFAIENYRIHAAAIDQARKLLADVQTRIKVGTLPAWQEGLFQYNLENLNSDLVDAARNVAEKKSALRNLLTDDLRDWGSADLRLTTQPSETAEHFDKVGAWRNALTKRPDFRQLEIQLEKLNLQLKFDRNQLYPQLDMVGSYAVNGIDPSLSSTVSQVQRASHSDYTYGMVMSIPFTRRAAKNSYNVDKEAKQQTLLQVKQLEINIMTQVENDGRAMATALERLPSLRKSEQLAAEVLKAEIEKLQMGSTTSFVVVEARRRLTSAQRAVLQALVDYNKYREQLSYDQGQNLEKNAITLEIR